MHLSRLSLRAVMLLAALAGAPYAMAATTVTISPGVVQSDGQAVVSGSGFGANEAISLDTNFYGEPEGTIVTATNGAGAFTYEFPEVEVSPGVYSVTAIGERSGDAASTTFSVEDDWAQYRYGYEKRGFNPYDNGLNGAAGTIIDISWSTATGGAISSSPAVADGIVYVGSYDHKLYAMNGLTGKILWSAATGGAILSSPAVVNNIAYVGSNDSKVYAFNAATGKLLWKYATGGAVTSSPLVVDNILYIGSGDGKLYALAPTTGSLYWATKTGAAITSSPAYDLGKVYVGSTDDTVYAFNSASGAVLWKFKTGGPVNSSPAVYSGLVYIGSTDKKFYGLDGGTGALDWSYATQGAINGSAAVLGNVFIGSADGNEYAFSPTGSLAAQTNIGTPIQTAASLTSGIYGPEAYYAGANGRIYANATECCSAQSVVLTLPAAALSSVVFSNDTAYVGAANGRLYALISRPASQQQISPRPARTSFNQVRVDRLE